jgi:hypothetical protein
MIKKYSQLNVDVYYHGSNTPNISEFKMDDSKFSLLGSGVYGYKNKESAERYGEYIYSFEVSDSDFKIAPIDFELAPKIILNSLPQLQVSDLKKYSGTSKLVWWATDGWDLYSFNRKEMMKNLISEFIKEYGYDGMLAEYPNGGTVICIWRKFNLLKPNLVNNSD